MIFPQPDDFIDIHTHKVIPASGVFAVENLMAHENINPCDITGKVFTAGIHPWYLSGSNEKQLLKYIREVSFNPALIALGEAGFDKLRGPGMEIQRRVFEEQVMIARERRKPVFIHCVKAWDELLAAHKKLSPSTKWMVHGFRGKKELAQQLLSRGMYISLWFEFVMRPESTGLLRFLPKDRIFLETDGAEISISDIYSKAAIYLEISVTELKSVIFSNYKKLFIK